MGTWGDQTRNWLAEVIEGAALARMDEQVRQLAQQRRPVVTFFGSYDTGKSALLRRILVDEGVAVPEWLTISGRHETFESNEVAAAGCLLRDTPGLGGTGDRADAHHVASSDATELTDVLLVVLTPQLATAELPAIKAALARGWTSEGVCFAVNRFDEAGVSPVDDPDGYRALAERKANELGEALPPSAEHRVFVIASDPYGLQGPAREVEPTEWDSFRTWDGMEALAAWVRSRPDYFDSLRTSALHRFWHERLTAALDGLGEAATALRGVRAESARAAKRLEMFERRLSALDSAAKAELRGDLSAVARRAAQQSTVDPKWLQQRIEESVARWFERSDSKLRDLNAELVTEFEVQSARPIIREFELLPPPVGDSRRWVPERSTVERLGEQALTAWRVFRESGASGSEAAKRPARLPSGGVRPQSSGAPSSGPRSGSPGSGTPARAGGRSLATATALAPLVYELFGLANQHEADRLKAKEAADRRKHLQSEIDRIIADAADANSAEWDQVVRSQREAAQAAWEPLAGRGPVVDQQLVTMERQLEEGRRLLEGRPEGS